MGSGGSGTDWDLERLKLLFDYTKFHIGVYTSVATVFGALVAAEDKLPIKPNPSLLIGAIAFILIAGAAGGTIASTIPHVTD